MTDLAAVAASLAQPATRSPLRPHYKPAALLTVLQLLDEGAVGPSLMDANVIVSRLRASFADFDPAHQLQVFQPLWHLRTNGAWSLLGADRDVLHGPEWGNYDKRPKSLPAFQRLVAFVAPASPASWADSETRTQARDIILQILRADEDDVSHAIAAAFALEAAERDGRAAPDWADDLRDRTWAHIVQRRGQARFRRELFDAYGGRCAISGCDAPAVLEAAHISKYNGAHTHQLANGLLLRADLHTLFDLHLLALDPQTGQVWIAPSMRETEYGAFHGRAATRPDGLIGGPSDRALQEHLREARRQNTAAAPAYVPRLTVPASAQRPGGAG